MSSSAGNMSGFNTELLIELKDKSTVTQTMPRRCEKILGSRLDVKLIIIKISFMCF
jgi:hypothetical protein